MMEDTNGRNFAWIDGRSVHAGSWHDCLQVEPQPAPEQPVREQVKDHSSTEKRKVMKKLVVISLVLAAGLLLFQSSSQEVHASPIKSDGAFVVNTTDLRIDPGNTCDRHCSLAEAILQANDHPGPDTISFNIPGTGPFYINAGTGTEMGVPLPPVTDDGTTIDGTTQPGYAGVLLIFLDGNGRMNAGLTIISYSNVIRGLGIIGFDTSLPEGAIPIEGAILVYGAENVIEFNLIGFDPHSELSPFGGGSGNSVGVFLANGSNIVRDNVISGNGIGIEIRYGHNSIYRNKIGTDPTGTYAVGNVVGINARKSVFIGLEEPGTGNLISGNSVGIILADYANRLYGNKIGTDISGAYGIPNGDGIWILNEGPQQTVIGPWPTCCTGEGNLIADNTQYGIWMTCAQEIFMWGNTIANNGSHGIELESGVPCETLHVRMLMNSFYGNGGLGIHFSARPRAVNEGISPPVITEIRGVDVHGTACPGCQVEIFLAAADPSGYGEGQEHLTAGYADLEGNFFNTIRRLGACDQVTATATDDSGNTSEFSANYHIGFCLRIPPGFIIIWIIPFFAAGAGTTALLGPRRTRGWLRALLGGFIGIGIGIGILFLPFVQVLSPPSPSSLEGPEPLSPPCSQYLPQAGLSPANYAVYKPGDDPIFELSPQPDPPGLQRRWHLTVQAPDDSSASLDVEAGIPSTLSELGLNPNVEGMYYWIISAEQRDADSEVWQRLCMDPVLRQFSIASNEQDGIPIAVPNVTANCRAGPTTEFSILSILPVGSQYLIQARNTPGDSWMVFDPSINNTCWVADELVEVSGDTGPVMIIDPQPPGLVLPTETPASVDCSQWSSNQPACIANPSCKWDPNLHPSSPCVNK
jgi:hypothetical protein